MTDETKPAARQRPADSPPAEVLPRACDAIRSAPIGDGTSGAASGAETEGRIMAAIRAAAMTIRDDASKPARLAMFERYAREGRWSRAYGICSKPNICGARRKNGLSCLAAPVPGRRRCKNHGGMSTGPRTEEGRERIRQAMLRRWAKIKAARVFDD